MQVHKLKMGMFLHTDDRVFKGPLGCFQNLFDHTADSTLSLFSTILSPFKNQLTYFGHTADSTHSLHSTMLTLFNN